MTLKILTIRLEANSPVYPKTDKSFYEKYLFFQNPLYKIFTPNILPSL